MTDLCGPGSLNEGHPDLQAFAEHWGNFGLLQFALAFIDQAAVLAVEIEPEVCRNCPAWYRANVYVESLLGADQMSTNNATDVPSDGPAVGRFLEPVKEILGTKYAAVGLVEDWDRSMHLFDQALRLPNYSWAKESAEMKPQNGNMFATEEHEMLQKAWTDPVVKYLLRVDIPLYEYAVSIHNQKPTDYGLSQRSLSRCSVKSSHSQTAASVAAMHSHRSCIRSKVGPPRTPGWVFICPEINVDASSVGATSTCRMCLPLS